MSAAEERGIFHSVEFFTVFLNAILRIKPDVHGTQQGQPIQCVSSPKRLCWPRCAAPGERCLDAKDNGAECLESEFRELSAFPCAIQLNGATVGATAHEFIHTDNEVQAVVYFTDAEEADPTSGPDNIHEHLLQLSLCQCSYLARLWNCAQHDFLIWTAFIRLKTVWRTL